MIANKLGIPHFAKPFALAAAALCAVFAVTAKGEVTFTRNNPVSGTELPQLTYTWAFTGSNGNWDDTTKWVNSSGDTPNAVPQAAGGGIYVPLLFDLANMPAGASTEIVRSGNYSGATYDIEGWTLNLGAFGGVNVAIKNIKYWQGGGGSKQECRNG